MRLKGIPMEDRYALVSHAIARACLCLVRAGIEPPSPVPPPTREEERAMQRLALRFLVEVLETYQPKADDFETDTYGGNA